VFELLGKSEVWVLLFAMPLMIFLGEDFLNRLNKKRLPLCQQKEKTKQEIFLLFSDLIIFGL
jgi:hypothetical protein